VARCPDDGQFDGKTTTCIRRKEQFIPMITQFKRSLGFTLATLALVASLFMATALPAGAHANTHYNGNDYAQTDSNHKTGAICDMERDGYYVVAFWYDKSGDIIAQEDDGGDSGCDQITFGGTAYSVKVCELWGTGASGCTEPKRV
jgi:hypothetical protein